MSFNKNLETTINNESIVNFLELCDEASENGIMTIEAIQSSKVFFFSKSLIILKWDEEKQDFLTKFWGSEIARRYGMDLTGSYGKEADENEYTQAFTKAHYEAMTERTNVYLSGTTPWRDKEYMNWDEVIMPLKRNGEVNETLTYVVFS